jgi:transcriptional regulator with XRE-family HTH domain
MCIIMQMVLYFLYMARKKLFQNAQALHSVGERVRTIRQKKGITQRELAQTLGVSQRVISYYENDSHNSSLVFIETVAKALGVPKKALVDNEKTTEVEKQPIRSLQKRLPLIADLPREDQKYLADTIDLMAAKRGIDNPNLADTEHPHEKD